MGKKDVEEKRFMQIPENFADLCNGVLFRGEQIVKPEELDDSPTETIKDKSSIYSDVAKRWKRNNTVISVIEVENQSQTDYAMVIRNVNMIASHYMSQLKEKSDRLEEMLAKNADLKADSRTRIEKEELLSGMLKDELFTPVIVIVINYNEEKWKGKKSLFELLNLKGVPKEYEKYLLNYEMVLFDYHDPEDYEMFHGETRTLFEALSVQHDKDRLINYLEGKRLSGNAARLLGSVMNVKNVDKYIYKNEKEEEEADMCTAIRELIADGRAEGMEEGMEKGESNTWFNATKALMTNVHFTINEAMDALNIPVEYRASIIERIAGE
ncbi:MAG: hypothetical protein K6A38_10995 [Lachnospiraceae bacterium]|nr:hypothetical protein [Lachnospiraceae bacterium]